MRLKCGCDRRRLEHSTEDLANVKATNRGGDDCGRLRAAGYDAYFAGGCVRDLLLGREPEDFDVATSAHPDVVLGMFPRTFGVGAHFGVVLIADEIDGQEMVTEVATFRSDGAYTDGRRPESVRFSDERRGRCDPAGLHDKRHAA